MKIITILAKLKNVVIDKDQRFIILSGHGFYDSLSDEEYIRRMYKAYFHKDIDLDNPKSFNEKIQWLKLHDRNPLYTKLVDKYEVKQYIADIIGEEYVIPTYGVWNEFDDIDFDSLPNQFVLKCTHDSGGIVIVSDKSRFDRKKSKEKLNKHLKIDYYKMGREWPYRDVPRRILAEKFISDSTNEGIDDYKVFCFSGIPRLIQVDYDRFVDHKRNLYSTDWELVDAEIKFKSDKNHIIEKPESLEKMLFLASTLASDFPFVRVDFYCVEGKLFFGELTFYHGSGIEEFRPSQFGYELGKYIDVNT